MIRDLTFHCRILSAHTMSFTSDKKKSFLRRGVSLTSCATGADFIGALGAITFREKVQRFTQKISDLAFKYSHLTRT